MLSLNLCFYSLKPDPRSMIGPMILDKPYDLREKLRELAGGQLLLAGDNVHPAIVLTSGAAIKLATVEMRGDWKWHREVFNLRCGWNSKFLRHHCLCTKSNYLQFPNPELHKRRDDVSFLDECKPDPAGQKST